VCHPTVLKTALYQLVAFELLPADTTKGEPAAGLRAAVSALLVGAFGFGVWALALSSDDSVKCLGLVAAL
jgi:hypothetical protein